MKAIASTLFNKSRGSIALNLEAIISYCHIVSRDRGPSLVEGQDCGAFLNALTEESVILLGMVADAGDICTMATRLMGREIFDVGTCGQNLMPSTTALNTCL